MKPRSQRVREWREKHKNSLCWVCGEKFEPEAEITIDHVWPQCLGGRDSVTNWEPAHKDCNSKRGPEVAEFLVHARTIVEVFNAIAIAKSKLDLAFEALEKAKIKNGLSLLERLRLPTRDDVS